MWLSFRTALRLQGLVPGCLSTDDLETQSVPCWQVAPVGPGRQKTLPDKLHGKLTPRNKPPGFWWALGRHFTSIGGRFEPAAVLSSAAKRRSAKAGCLKPPSKAWSAGSGRACRRHTGLCAAPLFRFHWPDRHLLLAALPAAFQKYPAK